MKTFQFIFLLIYIVGNVIVTRRIFRDPSLRNEMIWRYLGIMWLLPIVGAIFCWGVNRDVTPGPARRGFNSDPGNYDSGPWNIGLGGSDSSSSDSSSGSNGGGGGGGGDD